MTYSLNEALYLKEYYSSKMIGRMLDDSTQTLVKEIVIEQLENDKSKFVVKANGQRINGVFILFKEIGSAANQFGLCSPDIVLKDLSQLK
ncbi:MAG: hypothetical protein DI598_14625 [Pseudopedobacter saltans]|uniref:Uncharacterized protein n=1 Tax=Pseudopedobacter saltans TaxID=151895 RepID=A0A2W5EQZ2_9SPHI|nr:MAG: hypothetical protein DI598_14625 [Pseudopedobacter saltans]